MISDLSKLVCFLLLKVVLTLRIFTFSRWYNILTYFFNFENLKISFSSYHFDFIFKCLIYKLTFNLYIFIENYYV